MKTVVKALIAIALASCLTAVGAAQAHKIDHDVVIRKTSQWAAKRCNQTPDCVRSEGRYCYPLSDHRRRCTAQVIRRLTDGNLVQCQTTLHWKLEANSNRVTLQRVGNSACGT